MKQLGLTPPLLMLTMGYPGAGKTHFSRQFAETYGLPCLSEDRLRYELFENPQFNDDEQEIIGRVLEYNLELLLKTKHTIICDGSFSTYSARKHLQQLAHKHGYRTLVIWLQTDMTTSAQRAVQRDRRNPDSKYSFAVEKAQFEKLAAKLNRPHDKETAVVVSGKHAFKGQHVTVLRKIAEMYALAAAQRAEAAPASSRRLIQ